MARDRSRDHTGAGRRDRRRFPRLPKWDPAALTDALRKADWVMFPTMRLVTASPFSLIGWLAKYKAMGSLPKSQSLVAWTLGIPKGAEF